jgi:hypothetical protein
MPYISEERREEMEGGYYASPCTPGELNYALTKVVNDYWKVNQNYQAINDVLGALEGAKLEFYRRVAAPYEDKKMKENGDVYV